MLAYSLMKLMSRIACVQPTCFNDALPMPWAKLAGWLHPNGGAYMAKENVKECLGVSETEAERIAKESVTRFGACSSKSCAIPSSIKPILGTLSTSKAWNTSKRLMPKARRHHVYGPLRKLGNAGGQYGPSGLSHPFHHPQTKRW